MEEFTKELFRNSYLYTVFGMIFMTDWTQPAWLYKALQSTLVSTWLQLYQFVSAAPLLILAESEPHNYYANDTQESWGLIIIKFI